MGSGWAPAGMPLITTAFDRGSHGSRHLAVGRRRGLLVMAGVIVACCPVLGPSSVAHGAMGALPLPGSVSPVTFPPVACEQRLAHAAGNGKLAIVGASFTAGVGAGSPGRSWAVLLARMLRWDAVVYGDPGAGYVRPGFERDGPVAAEIGRIDLRALRPTLIIVQAGHDDIGVPPGLERSRVEQTIAMIRAQAPQARIALITVFTGRTPKPAAYQTDAAIVAGATAADSQVILIDPLEAGWRFQRVHDGLHPTADGSAWIAGKVAQALEDNGIRPAAAWPDRGAIICDRAVPIPAPGHPAPGHLAPQYLAPGYPRYPPRSWH